jgi:hypothetical protein
MNDDTASEVREIVDRETTVVTDFERPVTPGKEWGFSAWLPPGGTARIEVGTDDGGTSR